MNTRRAHKTLFIAKNAFWKFQGKFYKVWRKSKNTYPRKSEPSDDFSLLRRFLSWTMLKSANFEKSVFVWFIKRDDFLLSSRRISSNLTLSWSPFWNRKNILPKCTSKYIITLTFTNIFVRIFLTAVVKEAVKLY